MALPPTTLLAPVSAPASAGTAARAPTGGTRAPNGDDGAASFAGALAAAAETREARSAGGADGADGADERDSGHDAADDHTAATAGTAPTESLPLPLPWVALAAAAESRGGAAALDEGTDAMNGSLLPAARASKNTAGDGVELADAAMSAREALAKDAAAALTTSGTRAEAAPTGPIARGPAVAPGAVPLPGELDAARVDSRRTGRSGGARADTEGSRGSPVRTATGEPPSGLPRPPQAVADLAAAPLTRTLQDSAAGDLRVAAIDAPSGGPLAAADDRLPGALTTAGAAAGAPTTAVAKAPEPQSPFEARLEAALNSPEFVPSLGAQVSTLVRNGIPEARLHLHPAELGPITVQIEIAGQSAQVNMAVEHPATRQVLEQAIPTLAAALRDSGLTLTGGGVFQQPREPQGQPGDARPGSGGRAPRDEDGDALAALSAAAPRARIQRGALDLYA